VAYAAPPADDALSFAAGLFAESAATEKQVRVGL
jgi:hypothetical protein